VVSIGDAREGVVTGDARRLHSVMATSWCGGEAMVRVGVVVAPSGMLSNIVVSGSIGVMADEKGQKKKIVMKGLVTCQNSRENGNYIS